METDAQTITPSTPSPENLQITGTSSMSARERAMATLASLGWDGEDFDEETAETAETAAEKPKTAPMAEPGETSEADPLAELAAKVNAKLKGKATPPAAKPTWDMAAYKANPIAYLESLGLDPIDVADTLFEHASLKPEERQARARDAELERYKQAELRRKQQEAEALERQQDEEAERGYLAHLESAKADYPHLMALEPADRLRYTYEVATLVNDAGEQADAARLAKLTELHVAKLASKLPGAGARDPKKTAVVGDRTGSSADGGAPKTITNQLTTESGSPAERDLSPEGRRAAAMRKAAALGW